MSASCEVYAPSDLKTALHLKSRYRDDLHVVAGGTLSVRLMSANAIETKNLMLLERLPLSFIRVSGRNVQIGAMTRLIDLIDNRLPKALVLAARSVRGLSIKSMATVGGNVFSPSPGCDVATALMALDAHLTLQSMNRKRSVPLEKFYRGPLKYSIRSNELVAMITVRNPPQYSTFTKLTPLPNSGPTIASVAIALDVNKREIVRRASVAVGGITTHPYRAKYVERFMLNKKLSNITLDQVEQGLVPKGLTIIKDANASSEYRERMVPVLFMRALNSLVKEVSRR
ncbi:MAG: FAD binding domain-containing protein [Aigarchaeota archaeon]|nr:FAD binding domain-containing protein [Aigarchaeota archaeon]MDW8092539.1 FAD binding domain-containing protein [Nitrososphaerota archaeon]